MGVGELQAGMDGLISAVIGNPASCENLATLMGVYEESKEDPSEID
jgi:hypothetical protein